ncbi:hypothetical protein PR202_ga31591 [Eleusine coracana subsp. coracana]|uniref:Protein kinase domain-containing protein n=1 Tax=Eleusine coracana subsp. coracana TaxID=191504 RepID=A0AAV5DTJ0_ELECO|nr:hypothetical protein PR202_ga31591 [Eleusine coracana subsp. coracana]
MCRPVLHGDIKPADIRLDENLTPKISDFGIARLLSADEVQHTASIIGCREFAGHGELHSNEETSRNGSTPRFPHDRPPVFFFGRVPRPYDLDDLLHASAEVLGTSRYSTTYKVTLESGTVLAVKRLRCPSSPEREFRDKAAEIGGIDHPNVVPLQAYCFSKDEKLMVYEYVAMGSLFSMLCENRGFEQSSLSWDQTVDARVAEHGIAHLFDPEAVEPSSGVGYHAPEVEEDPRKLSHKSDVYSFGVLLLELLTGEMPTPNEDLPLWVRWSMVEEEWTSKLFDDELLGEPGAEEGMMEMLQLAFDCTADLPDKRPAMPEILGRLAEQTL